METINWDKILWCSHCETMTLHYYCYLYLDSDYNNEDWIEIVPFHSCIACNDTTRMLFKIVDRDHTYGSKAGS